IRGFHVTGVQTCALPISIKAANGVVTISGNGEGTDTARGVEVFRFSDGDYAFNAATGALVQFGDGKTGAGPKAVLPSVAFDPKRSEERRVGTGCRSRCAP